MALPKSHPAILCPYSEYIHPIPNWLVSSSKTEIAPIHIWGFILQSGKGSLVPMVSSLPN